MADLASFILRARNWRRGVGGEKNGKARQHCEGTNRLVDMGVQRVITMLFEQGKNPIQLIKIKDWRKVLEYATDKAEDAACSGGEIV